MHTVRNTKLNYDEINKMQNLACDCNCTVKVKGAGDITRKATVEFEWAAGRVGISNWETSLRLSMV